ncbi:hypothetical protein [Oceanidesulfovibrio marinus]|nr:hypothetical protein [Oceanidesulfovibrio marinus]
MQQTATPAEIKQFLEDIPHEAANCIPELVAHRIEYHYRNLAD